MSEKDFDLLCRAKDTLEANILTRSEKSLDPLPWHPLNGICPSQYTFRGMWNWDSAFHAIGVVRWNPEMARDQIRIFLEAQLPSGALPDVIREDGRIVDNFGKPPVMPWATAIIDQRDQNDDFLKFAYERFISYESFWRRERGGEANGLLPLCHYTFGLQRRNVQSTWRLLRQIPIDSFQDSQPLPMMILPMTVRDIGEVPHGSMLHTLLSKDSSSTVLTELRTPVEKRFLIGAAATRIGFMRIMTPNPGEAWGLNNSVGALSLL